jgi:hypothetical protein
MDGRMGEWECESLSGAFRLRRMGVLDQEYGDGLTKYVRGGEWENGGRENGILGAEGLEHGEWEWRAENGIVCGTGARVCRRHAGVMQGYAVNGVSREAVWGCLKRRESDAAGAAQGLAQTGGRLCLVLPLPPGTLLGVGQKVCQKSIVVTLVTNFFLMRIGITLNTIHIQTCLFPTTLNQGPKTGPRTLFVA